MFFNHKKELDYCNIAIKTWLVSILIHLIFSIEDLLKYDDKLQYFHELVSEKKLLKS